MAEECWIIVPNWEKFQHYSDRDPTWFKVYSNINSNADFLQLSCTERGVLLTIWAEYARSNGQVLQETVQRLCGSSARQSHWKALNDAGLVRFVASKPLALTRSREKRREEKKEKGAHAPKLKPAPTEPRMNAAAYRRHNPDEPFDYEAALAEITRKAGR